MHISNQPNFFAFIFFVFFYNFQDSSIRLTLCWHSISASRISLFTVGNCSCRKDWPSLEENKCPSSATRNLDIERCERWGKRLNLRELIECNRKRRNMEMEGESFSSKRAISTLNCRWDVSTLNSFHWITLNIFSRIWDTGQKSKGKSSTIFK